MAPMSAPVVTPGVRRSRHHRCDCKERDPADSCRVGACLFHSHFSVLITMSQRTVLPTSSNDKDKKTRLCERLQKLTRGKSCDHHRQVPLRSSTLQDRGRTAHGTPLLASRLPIYRCGFGHSERLLPERGRECRGGAIGLNEPRRERQPRAPTILPDMRDACVHSERGAAAHDRRRVGTLDDPEIGKPQMTIWTSSAPTWAVFDPNIQRDGSSPPQ